MVDDDTNGRQDVFVRDLEGRLTTRVSVDVAGGDPNDHSQSPDISGDGRYVAFSSFASDLVPNDGNGTVDVFLRDLLTSTTTRISVDRKGNDANGSSGDPSVSADGRYVAFQSYASDLIVGDRNDTADIFVRDLVAGATRRVSVDTAGDDADNFSSSPDISADGNHIAFTSSASDLVADDRNVCFSEFGPVSCADVFLRDVAQDTTLRVSVDAGGGDANDASASPSINGDGLRIAFASDASNIVTDDRNAVSDIFVREVGALRDAVGYATRRVSVDTHGRDADLFSLAPAISADGRAVAFESFATDLVAGDANGTVDVFLRPIPYGPH